MENAVRIDDGNELRERLAGSWCGLPNIIPLEKCTHIDFSGVGRSGVAPGDAVVALADTIEAFVEETGRFVSAARRSIEEGIAQNAEDPGLNRRDMVGDLVDFDQVKPSESQERGQVEEECEIDEFEDDDGKWSVDRVERYVLNEKTHVYHYPGCRMAGRVQEEDRREIESSWKILTSNGYRPCGICRP